MSCPELSEPLQVSVVGFEYGTERELVFRMCKYQPQRSMLSELLALQQAEDEYSDEYSEEYTDDDSEMDSEGGGCEPMGCHSDRSQCTEAESLVVPLRSAPIAIPCSQEKSIKAQHEAQRRELYARQVQQLMYQQQVQQQQQMQQRQHLQEARSNMVPVC